MGCTAHVLFHQPHTAAGLEVETARIEADALADDRDSRIARLTPFEFNEARRSVRGGSGADRSDERIAFVEIVAGCYAYFCGTPLPFLSRSSFQLGGPEISGWRVHEIANERRRISQPYCLIDLRRFPCHEDARTTLRLFLFGTIVVEAVLREEPAERGSAGLAVRKLVSPFGQALAEFRKAPRGERAGILDRAHHLEISSARKERERKGVSAVEAMGIEQGPILGWPTFQPRREAVFVD